MSPRAGCSSNTVFLFSFCLSSACLTTLLMPVFLVHEMNPDFNSTFHYISQNVLQELKNNADRCMSLCALEFKISKCFVYHLPMT
jgi:hypothetical protein